MTTGGTDSSNTSTRREDDAVPIVAAAAAPAAAASDDLAVKPRLCSRTITRPNGTSLPESERSTSTQLSSSDPASHLHNNKLDDEPQQQREQQQLEDDNDDDDHDDDSIDSCDETSTAHKNSTNDNNANTTTTGKQTNRGSRGRGRLRGILRLLLRTYERDVESTYTCVDVSPVYRTRQLSLASLGSVRDAIPALMDFHVTPRAVLRLAGNRRPPPRGLFKLPHELVRMLATFMSTTDCFYLQQTCRWNNTHFATDELWTFLYEREGMRRRHLRLSYTHDYSLWLQAKRRVDIAWERLKRFLPAAARAWSLNGHSAQPEALRDLEYVVWLHMRDQDPFHTRSHLPLELAASLVVENGESELGMFFGVAVWRLLSAQEIANALQQFTFWGWPYSRVVAQQNGNRHPDNTDENHPLAHPLATTANVNHVSLDGVVPQSNILASASTSMHVSARGMVGSPAGHLGVLIPVVSLSQHVGFEFVCVDSLSGRVYQYNSSTSLAVFLSKSWTRYLQVQ